MDHLYWLVPVVLASAGCFLFYWHRRRKHAPPANIEEARAQFHAERMQLQQAFFDVAARSGKPRGLRWKECQWNDLIAWARDKQTGQLFALLGVTIAFEAIEGGDMEGVEAVGNLRNATAVFYFHAHWKTAGRVVFNMNPDEALAHFGAGYERVGA